MTIELDSVINELEQQVCNTITALPLEFGR